MLLKTEFEASYREVVFDIIAKGIRETTRIGEAITTLGFNIEIPMGVALYRPNFNRLLAFVEGLEVIGGTFNPDYYNLVSPNLKYAYKVEDSSYGLRLADQMPLLIEQLRSTPTTRRAIVHIGNPGEIGEQTKVCVDSYVFNILRGKLNMTMFVRSWDIGTGFVYDTMVASMVGLMVAKVVGVEPGSIFGMAANAHVYLRDIAAFSDPFTKFPSEIKVALPFSPDSWEQVATFARTTLQAGIESIRTGGLENFNRKAFYQSAGFSFEEA